MAIHRVFYSFYYNADAWRTSQIRNIGVVEENKAASDNDSETVKKGGDKAIQKWIDDQLNGRSCTVVLIGIRKIRSAQHKKIEDAPNDCRSQLG